MRFLLAWVFLCLLSMPCLGVLLEKFNRAGFKAEHALSSIAEHNIKKNLPYFYNKVTVLFLSDNMKAGEAAFNHKVKKALKKILDNKIYNVVLPLASKRMNQQYVTYATITIKKKDAKQKDYVQLEALLSREKGIQFWVGGEHAFLNELNQLTQKDLLKADMIAAPIALILLLLIFGSFGAAMLPIIVGAISASIILASLYLVAHYISLSIFTINIALLLGLCLTLDYSLFIVKRFREEYSSQTNLNQALAQTLFTAGRSVFISGLTVLISLMGLLIFPVNILQSLAIGGIIAVLIAVLGAITLLPSFIRIFSDRIGRASKNNIEKRNGWERLASYVIHHRYLFSLGSILLLMFLSIPFIDVKFGISDQKILPTSSSSYQFVKQFKQSFPDKSLTPIYLLITSNSGGVLERKNLQKLTKIKKQLLDMKQVEKVESIIPETHNSQFIKYIERYKSSKHFKPMIDLLSSNHATVMAISFLGKPSDMIEKLRNLKPIQGLQYEWSGTPVINYDVLAVIDDYLIYTLLWTVCAIYMVLLFTFRSCVLPLKAIIMNLLSLSACFGVLVFVFQQGHGAEWLHFQPQGMIDMTLLVIIFCALFGFSMDYEVFLLSRVYERYLINRNTNQSVIEGIAGSATVITSAALIVIVICGSFMVADVLMVKAFGLGIAIAITVDAFIIRTLLVPASMALMEKWNWYLPKCLRHIKGIQH